MRSIRASRVVVLAFLVGLALLAVVLWRSSTGEAPRLPTESAILATNAKEPVVAAALEAIALDTKGTTSTRYSALRKLERQSPELAVTIAEQLAKSKDPSPEGEFLRVNAIAVLARSKSREGELAVERLTKDSPQTAQLVAQIRGAK